MAKFQIQSLGINALRQSTFPKVTPEQNDLVFDGKDATEFVSQLGNPVFTNLVFDARNYVVKGETIVFDGIRIDTVLMTVNQTKNIVKTPVAGRNGTVKEYISDGDFSISVNGQIVSENAMTFPKQKVNELIKILNIPTAISLTSEFLNYFDISSVVVDSFSFPQQQGTRNVQPFSLTLSSDTPVEIQLRNDEQIELDE